MFDARYQEIVKILQQRIEHGLYPERLPSLRELCFEFSVCKSTMSKVFNKLAYAGWVRVTRHGTLVLKTESFSPGNGMVAVISSKLNERYREQDELFLGNLKSQLAQRGFSSVRLEIEPAVWSDQTFWRRLDFDGYIFVYSSFYQLSGDQIRFCAKPRVVGNWLPDDIGEYFVDFDYAAGLKDTIAQVIEMGYKNIALAIDIKGSSCGEAYYNIWRKLMRNYKLTNYNSALEDFAYSEKTGQRWAALTNPPEFVICANIAAHQVAADMKNCRHEVTIANMGEDSGEYGRLAEALAQTFAAVYSQCPSMCKRNLIGHHGRIQKSNLLVKKENAISCG